MELQTLRPSVIFNLILALVLVVLGSGNAAADSTSHGRFLTGPNAGDPLDIATRYVTDNHQALGLTMADVADFSVSSHYTSETSGTTHISLNQLHDGIRAYNALITINIAADGSVMNAGNRFIADLAGRVDGAGYPSLTAAEAVEQVADHLGLTLSEPLNEISGLNDREQTTRFTNGGISRVEIPVHLTYQLAGKTVRLAWEVDVQERRSNDHWSIRVDATTGAELDRHNMTVYDSYQSQTKGAHSTQGFLGTSTMCDPGAGADDHCVYPMPIESPNFAVPAPPGDARTMQSTPWTPSSASPYGWNDLDGAPGPETNTTEGNNVDAQKGGFEADGGVNRIFNFGLDLTVEPTVGSNVDAAIANLYYWNNIIHDVWSGYGFDEASGNFQENNYGNGGVGSDSVTANAQAAGNCNATFGTPPDGSNPSMNMFTCNIATPSRDGDFDNGVIAHEYWHGISNRLTGGPATTSCLSNGEQAGEGWSDLGGLLMTIESGDLGTDPRGIGTWLLGEGPTGPGVRNQRYSTDFGVNTHTYNDVNTAGGVHDVGEIWASIVWEVVWDLIDAHGFNPNFYEAWNTGGNNLANQLIIDGLKLQPCSPGFVDARDAIILADQALTGGANECLLWSAFARRGLGFSANQGSTGRGDETEAFDIPIQCLFDVAPDQVAVCSATNEDALFNVGVPPGFFTADVTLSGASTPGGAAISFSVNPVTPGSNSIMTVTAPTVDYSILVTGNDGLGHVANDTVNVVVSSAVPAPTTLLIPANGATGVSTMPTLEWTPEASITEYVVDVATDPSFFNIVYSMSTGLATSHALTTPLSGDTVYYWRVIDFNGCGAATSSTFSFRTVPMFCSTAVVPIPDNDPTGTSDSIVIAPSGPITDLNLTIQATHTWVGDVSFTLTNETTGTSVAAFDRPGVPASSFGCSEDNIDVILDDEGGSGPVEDACPVDTGLDYTPNEALSAFDGEDLAATWTLTITDAAGGDSGNLTGWCIEPAYDSLEPEITVAPLALGFGNQPIADGPTAAQAVVITNDGTATLTITSVGIVGPDLGEFGILSDTGEGTLAPAATRTIMINFDPTTVGPKAATLAIDSDDADEPTVPVDLTGTGTSPDIGVAPPSLAFGSQVANGGPGAPQDVTITNLGTAVLSITSVSLTGPDLSEFGIASDTGEPTLAPGTSRTVSVHFDPTSVGPKAATLAIDSDDPDQPSIDVGLTGTGVVPDIGVTPLNIVFSPHVAGTGASSPRAVTITNLGTSVLSITSVSLTGPDLSEFGISSDTGEPTLAPAASRTVMVHFNPTSTGVLEAALTISSDDPDQPTVDVVLSGKSVTAGEILFMDGFESGDPSGWSSSSP